MKLWSELLKIDVNLSSCSSDEQSIMFSMPSLLFFIKSSLSRSNCLLILVKDDVFVFITLAVLKYLLLFTSIIENLFNWLVNSNPLVKIF